MAYHFNLNGTSLISSLGLDAETSCASARAGISRAKSFAYPTPENNFKLHAVPMLPDIACLSVRLSYLLDYCLKELFSKYRQLITTNTTGLYIVLPDIDRWEAQPRLFPTEEAFNNFSLHHGESISNAQLWAQVNQNLGGLGGNLDSFSSITVKHGNAFHELYTEIKSDFETTAIDLACVVCIDTLIDQTSIAALNSAERLKQDSNPQGLMPGEAASALLLSKSEKLQSGTTLSYIGSTEESESLAENKVSFADAHNLLTQHVTDDFKNASELEIYFNLNGEPYFSHEWAYVHSGLAKQLPNTTFKSHYPIIDWGDMGLAFINSAITAAHAANERNYASSNKSMIYYSANDGHRALFQLDKLSH